MKAKAEMTKKDLLNACAILTVLKDGGEFLPSEIQKRSGLTSRQTVLLLEFLSEKLYVIPRVVPEENRLLLQYGASKRGLLFLKDTILVHGTNQVINFTLSGKELRETLNFSKKHKCGLENDQRTGRKKTGAIGGSITYCFTPTSLGTMMAIKCACGKNKNITDYDSW